MLNDLFENIQQHLSMLDLALHCSQKITSLASLENLDGVISETDNRERLVNIIGVIQQKIENQINQLNAAELKEADILILKAWFQDLSTWSDKMIELDKETVELLSQQKEETTKEIAHIFKNKEMFKGYNNSSKK
ncbi:MAG: hypothetical protein H7336_13910 [Bacteriovorax sp.]|nr:hypothetical protein [Bacteriovorax sp.]